MSGDKNSQGTYQEATKELHSNEEVRYMLHLVQVGVEHVQCGHVCMYTNIIVSIYSYT